MNTNFEELKDQAKKLEKELRDSRIAHDEFCEAKVMEIKKEINSMHIENIAISDAMNGIYAHIGNQDHFGKLDSNQIIEVYEFVEYVKKFYTK